MFKKNRLSFIVIVSSILLGGCVQTKETTPQDIKSENIPTVNEEETKEDSLRKLSDKEILLQIGEKDFKVQLYDNPTAQDLITKLPLTLKVNNYGSWEEKIIKLKQPLSMQGAPAGDEPEIPEVGYYQPGQWIALYYGYIGYWEGKVPLGKIDASIAELKSIEDNDTITIEFIKD